MSPTGAIVFLGAIYFGAMYGGAISGSIMVVALALLIWPLVTLIHRRIRG